MTRSRSPRCCCGCLICDDLTGEVGYLVGLLGILDGTTVPTPPGLASCPSCGFLNVSYPLTYIGLGLAPVSGCITLTDPPASSLEICEYGYDELCESGFVGPGTSSFGRILNIRLRTYKSLGGNRRGYLEVTLQSTVIIDNGFSIISHTRLTRSAADFLIHEGSGSTNCLDIDVAEPFTLCSTEGSGSTYDCGPPTSFTLQAVEL